MRNRWNLVVLTLITALTVFSIFVVWPGYPKRYLPDFVDWPEGNGLAGREAMRLGLDLNGGTHLLLEADLSQLPAGTDVDGAMEGAKEIIERRVNAFGVSETEISREGKNRLAVQLPGIPPDEARDLVGKTALLEFRQPVLDENLDMTCLAPDGSQFPVSTRSFAVATGDGHRVAQCFSEEAGESGDLVVGELLWEPATGADRRGDIRVLTGRFLRSNATVSADPLSCGGNPSCVVIEFSGDGGLLFQEITGRLIGYPLGIFLDEDLISAPIVQSQISGDSSVISGLDLDEAQRLRVQLNAGALPVPLREIQSTAVDATLGENTLVRSVQAGLIGILAVMAFMVFYYRVPGVLASLALLTYISTVMMIFKLGPIIGPVTITLPAIAGLVLSVGMAVDANILVFERMKEELRGGRSLAGAIEHGFDRAWSSIRASNLSTLISAGILWWFGDQFGASLVKGFALTLGIGVVISMFSAIIVTRTLLRLMVGTPLARRLSLFAPDLGGQAAPGAAVESGEGAGGGPRRGRPGRSPFMVDFVKRRRFYFLISAVLLLPGVISLLIPPSLEPGIEFSSGATFTAQFEDAAVSQTDVRDVLADLGHDEARVQRTGDGAFIVRTSALEGPVGPPVGPPPRSEVDTIREALILEIGPLVDLNGEVTNSFQNFNSVSEIVSREIGRDAAIALAAAAVAILLFITFSFRHVPNAHRYGVAAIVAAMHDALFIVGAFSIFGKLFGTEVNTMFITGVLTIIGFSVHDTIVVFDRIRENVARHPDVPFAEAVNASLTETLGRSLNTSVTLLFTIVSLLLIGGAGIDALLVVMLLGVLIGTYSSIFIASQVLIVWEDGDLGRLYRRILPGRAVPERPVAGEAEGL